MADRPIGRILPTDRSAVKLIFAGSLADRRRRATPWLLLNRAATVGIVSRLAVALAVLLAPLAVSQAQTCPADCSGDNQVVVNELIACVGIVLQGGPSSACPACDGNDDGAVAINELIAGVNSALDGCTPRDLADLEPVSARFRSTTPSCINDTSEIALTLEVCVANRGTVASGPFDLHVLGEPFARIPGLAIDEQTCLEGPYVPFSIDVLVDASEEVQESDERDNLRSFNIAQPTPPPFCTATPTVTPTADVTDTATETPTETPTATVEPTI
jgi:hypothetical protein